MQDPIVTLAKLEERLAPILDLLQKQQVVQAFTHRQAQPRAELIENLLHRQQEAELRRKLNTLNAPDIAHLLQMLPTEKRLLVWNELPHKTAAAALVEVSEAVAESLIERTRDQRLTLILEELDADDLAEIAEYLPRHVLEQAKALMEANERRWLESSLTYPEESVGEIMSKDSLIVPEDVTIDQAIDFVRSATELPPQTDKLFIVDRHRRLVGIIPLIGLMRHDGARVLSEVMDPKVVSFSPLDPAEEAGQAFERYDLISAPVVDDRRRVIGRLTVESVMDFLRAQAANSALAKEGLSPDTDLLGPIWEGARERWPWLCINLMTAFLATRFISLFEGTIQHLVALATLMPIVASVGGNTGNQTTALLIRGIAMNQVHRDSVGFIYRKEIAIGFLNGLIWGSVMGLFAWFLYHNWMIGMVMTSAVTLNLTLAAIIGVSIPLLLDRLDRDPAMGASVVLTFCTDSMGFFIFLGLATLVLN